MIRMRLTDLPLLALLSIACLAPCPGATMAADDIDLFKPADTSSPRDTLKSFIDACNEIHHQIETSHFIDRASPKTHASAVRALDCLDTSELPEFARLDLTGEAAICLKEILDRIELPPDSDWEYLAFSEKVNFQIFQVFDEQGIQFSLPFRVTHTSIKSEAMPVQVNVLDARHPS